MADNLEPNVNEEEVVELTPEQVADLEVTVKVDGVEKAVKVKDLQASYQKDAAASDRLRQATEEANANREAIEIGKAMRAAKAGDTDALIGAMTKLGFDPNEVREQVSAIQSSLQDEEDTEVTPRGKPAAKAEPTPSDVFFANLFHKYGLTPNQVSDIIGTSIHTEGKSNRRLQIKTALDSDKELATILSKRGTDPNALIGLVDKVLLGQLQESGAELSEASIKKAVQETATILKAFRASAATGNTAPGGTFDAAALADFGPGKTPKRPSSTSGDDYEVYLQKKIEARHRMKSLEEAEA